MSRITSSPTSAPRGRRPRLLVALVVVVGALSAGLGYTVISHADAGQNALSLLATPTVGNGPGAIAVDATRHEAFIADTIAGTITPVSTTTGKPGPSWPVLVPETPTNTKGTLVPGAPTQLTVDPAAVVDGLKDGVVIVSAGLPIAPATTGPTATCATVEQTVCVPPFYVVEFDETNGKELSPHALVVGAARLAVDPASGVIAVTEYAGDAYESRVVGLMENGLQPVAGTGFASLDGTTAAGASYDAAPALDVVEDPRPAGGFLVSAGGAPELVVISEAPSFSVTGVVALPYAPQDLAINPSGTMAWTTDPTAGLVTEINLRTLMVVGTFPAGAFPEGIAYDPTTNALLVTDPSSGTLYDFNAANGDGLGNYPVGGTPLVVAVDSGAHVVITSDATADTATLLRETTGLVTTNAPATAAPAPPLHSASPGPTGSSTSAVSVTATPSSPASATPSDSPSASAPAASAAPGIPQQPSATASPSPTTTAADADVLTLSPNALTFPATATGSTSTAQTVMVRNTGADAAAVSSVVVNADASSQGAFTVTADGCTGQSLAPAATCTVSVAFTPDASGDATGALTVSSSGVSQPPAALTGVGQ